jgi:hypothetical protein
MGEDRETFDWLYEATRNGNISTLIHGIALRAAESNPTWTYMQVLTYVRKKVILKEFQEII